VSCGGVAESNSFSSGECKYKVSWKYLIFCPCVVRCKSGRSGCDGSMCGGMNRRLLRRDWMDEVNIVGMCYSFYLILITTFRLLPPSTFYLSLPSIFHLLFSLVATFYLSLPSTYHYLLLITTFYLSPPSTYYVSYFVTTAGTLRFQPRDPRSAHV
jgi:hypothetical protein